MVGGWIGYGAGALVDISMNVFAKGGNKVVLRSWVTDRPKKDESGKDFAKRQCDNKYGEGNYKTGPDSEFNKIKKWVDYKK